MNHLISVRTNVMYSKVKEEGKPDTYKRFQELIFLVDKPDYRRSTEGEVVRERGIEELRFVVSDKAFDELMKILEKLNGVDETELG